MTLSLIVAMATNRAIGIDNKMPWHLSADLKKFRKITTGHPIIMGRKTFESIGRPLPDRQNVIISRNPDYQATGCLVFDDIHAAIAHFPDEDEIFIIGGATLYNAVLAETDKLYITEINQDFAGDTFFPEIKAAEWQEREVEVINDDDSVDFDYRFVTYERCR